jgi:hypothetical protein
MAPNLFLVVRIQTFSVQHGVCKLIGAERHELLEAIGIANRHAEAKLLA